MEFTNEQVYALGLFWADGYLLTKRSELRLEVVADDFEYFLSFFSSLGKVEVSYRQRVNRRKQARGTIRNKNLTNFLEQHDYTAKSLNSPCKIINQLKIEQVPYFILGWVDGDGCFYWNEKANYVQFAMAGSFSQDWSALTTILDQHDIKYKIRKQNTKSGNASWLRITGNNNLKNFYHYIYQTNIGLPRKKEKAFKIFNKFRSTV